MALLVVTMLVVMVGIRLYDNRKVAQISEMLREQASKLCFADSQIAGLPEVVQRYFRHSIASGTPLASSARLRLGGSMRLNVRGKFRKLKADQTFSLKGYVWRVVLGGVFRHLAGSEVYVAGNSRLLWWQWGLIPFNLAHGQDSARSAAGRAAMERILLPATLLSVFGVRWEALAANRARAVFHVDGFRMTLDMEFTPAGGLRTATMQRWNDVARRHVFAEAQYVLRASGEERYFTGYTVPAAFEAGWSLKAGEFLPVYAPEVEAIEYR